MPLISASALHPTLANACKTTHKAVMYGKDRKVHTHESILEHKAVMYGKDRKVRTHESILELAALIARGVVLLPTMAEPRRCGSSRCWIDIFSIYSAETC